MSKRHWLVFDTETTGLTLPSEAALKDQPRIIEFAVALVDGEANAVLSEHSWLIYPECGLSDEITKITGLTDADLKGKPTFAQVLPEIVKVFLGVQGLVAHNLPFDRQMLVNELRHCGKEFAFPYPPNQMCTVSAYHHLKGRNMRLIELYEDVIGKPLAQTHRALDDVRALVEILLKEEVLG